MITHILEQGMDMDRRQKKTHIAIETALIELMGDKPLEEITISELAQKADINRKTFYNNYTSVDDVLTQIEEKLLNYITDSLPDKIEIENEISIYHLFLDLAHSLIEYKEVMSKLFQNRSALLLKDNLQTQLFPYVERSLSSYNVDARVIPYINHYILDGVFSIFGQWFAEENSLTPEQVALLAYNLTISVIKLDNYRDLHKTI